MATNQKTLIALVGMPGAGKSSVVSYITQKNIPFVRFGDITEEQLRLQHLPITPDTENTMREQLRVTYGMNVYAKKSLQKITTCFETSAIVVIDGLYSWEEYIFLKELFPNIVLIHVFAERNIRYERLTTRSIRPLTLSQAQERDIAEIEQLNKGGPIAIADYLLNNSTTQSALHEQIDALYKKLDMSYATLP